VFCGSGSSTLGHDSPSPIEPSVKFEAMIAEGMRNIDENSDKAVFFSADVRAARSVYDRAALWTSKTALRVCFWNGDRLTQEAVIKSAMRWNVTHLSLSFYDRANAIQKCVDGKSADIRIALVSTDTKIRYEAGQDRGGNWSLMGRQAEFVPQGKPAGSRYDVTMNLPYIASNLRSGDLGTLDFTVGHEFGHALGLLHEFQLAKCEGWIDIKQMAKDQGWSGDLASYALDPLPAIASKFRIDIGLSGDYDVRSIMQYNFAVKYFITKAGEENPCQRKDDVTQPSTGDLQTVVAMYGASTSDQLTSTASRIAAQAVESTAKLRTALRFASRDNGDMAAALRQALVHIEKIQAFERGR